MNTPKKPNLLPVLLLGLSIFVTILVYLPGLKGPFIFDDFTSIVANSNVHITDLSFNSLRIAWFGEISGPLGRPLSAVSFAINHFFSGLTPLPYKVTNLAIHSLNGLLLWFFLGLLFRATSATSSLATAPIALSLQYLRLFVVAAWLLHPLNLTGVLYVVQRMTSLAAFFSLIGLSSYVLSRTARCNYDVHLGWLCVTVLATIAAALSKENGLLVPALALVIEFTVFNGKTNNKKSKYLLSGFFSLLVFIPGFILIIVLLISPEKFLSAYQLREFDLFERLLTQARVIWFHISQLYLPRPNAFNLFHDSFTTSHGLYDPPTTILSLIGLIAIFIAAIYIRRKNSLLSLGVLFFLVGHSMESTILPLEMVHEHRNYLPSVGLLLVVGYFFLVFLPSLIKPKLAISLGVIFLVVCASITSMRSGAWSSLPDLVAIQIHHRPDSPRAHSLMGSHVYFELGKKIPEQRERFYQLARHHLLTATTLRQSDALSPIILIEIASRWDRPIEQEWINLTQQRLESESFPPITGIRLIDLLNCVLSEECKLDISIVGLFIDAALKNDRVDQRNIANLTYAKSLYLLKTSEDYDLAVHFAQRSAEAYPEPSLRVHLADLLIALHRLDEAEEEIQKMREADRHRNRLTESIQRLESQLEQVRNKQTKKFVL